MSERVEVKLKDKANSLDELDPLRGVSEKFHRPAGTTYLVGHSLGLMCDSAREFSEEVFRQWRTNAVESWFDKQEDSSIGPWLEIESKFSKLLAPFLGATENDVTVTGSLGLNLIVLLHSFYRPKGDKKKIAIMRGNFPQDRWLVGQHLRLPGFSESDIHWIEPRPGERLTRDEDLVKLLAEKRAEIAVLVLESVSYITGQAFDIKKIAEAAKASDIRLILDVAHGAFVLPLELNQWGVDGAVGCSYKFGCSGPGGPGLLYVNQTHWEKESTWRPGGWWGNDRSTQFLMGPAWKPAKGVHAWQISTVPILSVAPFYGALKLFSEAGIAKIREKGISMVQFFIESLESIPGINKYLEILTPKDPRYFGSEVAIEFFNKDQAKSLKEWLRKEGVLVDYREAPFDAKPGHSTKSGILRAGFHPMFNQYSDIVNLVEKIRGYLKV